MRWNLADDRGRRLTVGNLVSEIALRLAKVLVVALLGAILYFVITGIGGASGSVELALLCWLSAAAFWLLIETSLL